MSGSDLNGAKTPPMGSAEMNAVMRAEYAKQGDDGTARRPIDHFAYPSSETASPREDILTWAKNCGFTAVEMEDGWVQFGHVDAIVGEAFDTITQDIGDALSAIGWTYDGWDCEAVSADEAAAGDEE